MEKLIHQHATDDEVRSAAPWPRSALSFPRRMRFLRVTTRDQPRFRAAAHQFALRSHVRDATLHYR